MNLNQTFSPTKLEQKRIQIRRILFLILEYFHQKISKTIEKSKNVVKNTKNEFSKNEPTNNTKII